MAQFKIRLAVAAAGELPIWFEVFVSILYIYKVGVADRMIGRRDRLSIDILRRHENGGRTKSSLHHVAENGDLVEHGTRPVVQTVDDDVFFLRVHFELFTQMVEVAWITDFLMGGCPVERRRRVAGPSPLLHAEGMVVRQARATAQIENA